MAIIYRLQKIKHNATTLSGEGAALTGNRWNYKGTPLIYTSTSASLAAWELKVHLGGLPLDRYPPFNFVVLEIPDSCIHEFADMDLPAGWHTIPSTDVCQAFIAPYLESGNILAFSVPSVVIPGQGIILPGERNILINPKQADISQVRILEYLPFRYDDRLKLTSSQKSVPV